MKTLLINPKNELRPPKSYHWDASSKALETWNDYPHTPQVSTDKTNIDIYDVIGEDFWSGGGFTEKKLAGILRDVGDEANVTVNINTPGGDLFEGVGIYNRLVKHKGKVTVNVTGIAASAGSIIAMAGDTVNMMTGSMLMIHNAWGAVIGNRHDFREAADTFEVFDKSLASIYAKRTGEGEDAIMALLDKETFMTAEDAVEGGFADNAVEDEPSASAKLPDDVLAKRRIEAALAKQGYTRKQRAEYLNTIAGARDAASEDSVRDATEETAALAAMISTMRTK